MRGKKSHTLRDFQLDFDLGLRTERYLEVIHEYTLPLAPLSFAKCLKELKRLRSLPHLQVAKRFMVTHVPARAIRVLCVESWNTSDVERS